MNNKELIDNFWRFNEIHKFSNGTIAMFFYLLYVQEENKKRMFVLNDKTLFEKLRINKNSIKSIREKLIDLKLINVKIQSGKAPVYDLVNLDNQDVEIIIKKESDTIKDKKGLNHKSVEKIEKNIKIPPLEEVIKFVRNLSKFEEGMDKYYEELYHKWVKNGWKDKYGPIITDYKGLIERDLPFWNKKDLNKIEFSTNEQL